MSFKKNGYQIVKKAISRELCDFICTYLLLKENATINMYQNKLVKPHDYFGVFGDGQMNGFEKDKSKWKDHSYSCYGDVVIETLCAQLTPKIEKLTKLKLVPTYCYLRIYENGSILKKHTDRPACEISSTIFFGGDKWPIFVDGKKVDLKESDILIYKGFDLPHWREEFKGKKCVQAFMHWNDINGPYGIKNKFDGRPCLGYPQGKPIR